MRPEHSLAGTDCNLQSTEVGHGAMFVGHFVKTNKQTNKQQHDNNNNFAQQPRSQALSSPRREKPFFGERKEPGNEVASHSKRSRVLLSDFSFRAMKGIIYYIRHIRHTDRFKELLQNWKFVLSSY